MQNRTMFPYRRPGQKKRPKNIANAHRGGKPKGPPPKGLPASVRDLLPMLQPATKALAQMLAGRTQQSGQYGHARAVLARAERAVAERAIDRLNPAEREEFFEQLARLKLTIADAEIEAEVVAEEAVAETNRPAPPPVARERLREVAMALAGPAPAETTPPPPADAAPAEPAVGRPEAAPEPVGAPEEPAGRPDVAGAAPGRAGAAEAVEPAARPRTGPMRRRLMLSGEQPPIGERRPAEPPATPADEAPAAAATVEEVNGRAGRRPRGTRSPAGRQAGGDGRDKKLHLPDGWMIDEEGYVVPRSG